ncbi:MAG: NADP-dependent oxidoreductase [Herbiconiux sp.]|uniref:NADP-dependent oxidoreductase n=1 Tax=Herbiconiux sp. TaxID=1871186 RepID=UPI00122A4188|nr:NADP-dependent oxidoreductase [Herbiconiux sp.]TAJ49479.1 MAG: NADP-dependent oxidoreductase [Herbiconiux sp.]
MAKKPSETSVIEYDQVGGADVLQARTRPLRAPEPGEVTVEVIVAGISHIDGFIRTGQEPDWAAEPFPRASGSDFAGVVVDSADPRFPRGTEVVGHVRSGAHATYLTVSADALVKKPKHVTWETAGGLYLAGVTALDTLDALHIAEGDTIVISAAAGAVGSIEAQLARYRGAKVIGTCGERNFDYLRQLGITPIQYGPGMTERIQAAAPRGVTAFIDNFGQDGHELARELGVPASRYRSSDDRRELELKLLRSDPETVQHATRQLAALVDLADKQAFSLLISGFYPLGDVALAYADLDKLHSRGKVVLATHPVSTFRYLKARDVADARN